MRPTRIAELLQPFLSSPCHSEPAQAGEESAVLSPSQLHSISTYIDILQRWNARINLTAIRSPEEIVTRHFGESLFAAQHPFPNEDDREGRGFSRASNALRNNRALATEAHATRLADCWDPPSPEAASIDCHDGFVVIAVNSGARKVSLYSMRSAENRFEDAAPANSPTDLV